MRKLELYSPATSVGAATVGAGAAVGAAGVGGIVGSFVGAPVVRGTTATDAEAASSGFAMDRKEPIKRAKRSTPTTERVAFDEAAFTAEIFPSTLCVVVVFSKRRRVVTTSVTESQERAARETTRPTSKEASAMAEQIVVCSEEENAVPRVTLARTTGADVGAAVRSLSAAQLDFVQLDHVGKLETSARVASFV
jgi:hypothetical protein